MGVSKRALSRPGMCNDMISRTGAAGAVPRPQLERWLPAKCMTASACFDR
jgi:hypothetical protein